MTADEYVVSLVAGLAILAFLAKVLHAAAAERNAEPPAFLR